MIKARTIFIFIAALACAAGNLLGQTPNTRITGFSSPNTDSSGRKSIIKGDEAEPAGPGIFRIRNLRVENYRADGALDSTIRASECLFDHKNTPHDVWSDKDLSMITADGRLSLKGVGFRFSNSHLTISNKVDATFRRQAVVDPSVTNAPANTNDFVHITSGSLEHFADSLTFKGRVHVLDPQGEVHCDILNVKLGEKNSPEEIEALDNVILSQEGTEARGKRAVFNRASGLLRLYENTHWRMGDREGQSELLILDRTNKTLRAETKVKMTLPSSLLATNTPGEPRANVSTNKLTISAETFDYRPTNVVTHGAIAIFNGDVHAVDPQAALDCELLTIFFDKTNRLARAVADRNVQITRTDGSINGVRAVFENDEITVPSNPTWRLKDNTGTAELLIFNPRTREVRALQKVHMEIPVAAASTNLFSTSPSTNRSALGTNILVVTADYFTNKENIATFASNVRASEPRGQIDANKIELHLNSSNRVQRAIATGDVIVTEQKTQAIGQKADYDVTIGIITLTGTPKVTTDNSETIAKEFRIDLNKHQREPIPPFQIKIRNLKQNTAKFP